MVYVLLCVIAVVACIYCAILASNAAHDAEGEAAALRASKGRIVANEASIEAVSERLRKLSGRVYKELASRDDEVTIEPEVETQFDFVGHSHALGHCDNWQLAQIEGPLSAAAKCECTYCQYRRQERSVLRKSLGTNHATAVKSIEARS